MADRDFLRETMHKYPLTPSYALWRAVELRRLAGVKFAEPVLDLGCGEGQFIRLLLGPAPRVIGLDMALKVLRQAAHMLNGVTRADATQLPFATGSFGSILTNCVLEHIPDDERVVAEMGRVVATGGLVVATVPAPTLKGCVYLPEAVRDDPDEREEYLREFDARLAHLHYRTADEWQRIFAAGGLTMERLEPYMAAPAAAIWSRVETQLMQPLGGITSYGKLLAYSLTPPPVRRALLYRLLRRYYLMDPTPGQSHGGWLIVARKSS